MTAAHTGHEGDSATARSGKDRLHAVNQPIDAVLADRFLAAIDRSPEAFETDAALEDAMFRFTITGIRRVLRPTSGDGKPHRDSHLPPLVDELSVRRSYQKYRDQWGNPQGDIAQRRKQEHVETSVAKAYEFGHMPEVKLLSAIYTRLIIVKREREAEAAKVILSVYGDHFMPMRSPGRRPHPDESGEVIRLFPTPPTIE